MKKSTLLLVLLGFGFIFPATAQNKIVVYGNLGVNNVNISVVNTRKGTSSNAKGYYTLPLYNRSKSVNLYYSCIGYQDTIVSLSSKQLQRDSVNISFIRAPPSEFAAIPSIEFQVCVLLSPTTPILLLTH